MVALKSPPPTAPYSAAKLLVWIGDFLDRLRAGLHFHREHRQSAVVARIHAFDAIEAEFAGAR